MLEFLKPKRPFRITNLEIYPKNEQVPPSITTSEIIRNYQLLHPFITEDSQSTQVALDSNGEVVKKFHDSEYVTTRLEVSLLPHILDEDESDQSSVLRRGSLVSYNSLISQEPTMQYEVVCILNPKSHKLRLTKISSGSSSKFQDFEGFFKRRGFTIETILSENSSILSRRDSFKSAQIAKLVERFEPAYKDLKGITLPTSHTYSNSRNMSLAQVVELKREQRGGDSIALNFLKSLYRRYPLHFARYK